MRNQVGGPRPREHRSRAGCVLSWGGRQELRPSHLSLQDWGMRMPGVPTAIRSAAECFDAECFISASGARGGTNVSGAPGRHA